MKSLVLILALLATSISVKAETLMTMTVASKHLKQDGLNEHNYGIGVNHEDAIVGFYENSFHRTSIYAGGEFTTKINSVLEIGFQAGMISGYNDRQLDLPSIGNFKPYILPEVIVKADDARVKIGIIPTNGNPVLTLQLEFRIK